MRECLAHLDELLPSDWHIQLELVPAITARLSPWAGQMNRVFSYTPRRGANPSRGELASLRSWLDMGNLYLKLLPTHPDAPSIEWLSRFG
jgi:hypothetical protein